MEKTYPEHEKLSKILQHSNIIGEFVEWLQEDKKIYLASYERRFLDQNTVSRSGHLSVTDTPIRDLLAEFFDIDLNKIEEEKQMMLEAICEAYSKSQSKEKR